MSYLDWHVGMKVVCVPAPLAEWRRHEVNTGYQNETLPKKGEVYTIRSLMMFGDVVCIHLVEIINRAETYTFPDGIVRTMECPFEAIYFRPVQPRKTDISIFTAMLHDRRQKVGA